MVCHETCFDGTGQCLYSKRRLATARPGTVAAAAVPATTLRPREKTDATSLSPLSCALDDVLRGLPGVRDGTRSGSNDPGPAAQGPSGSIRPDFLLESEPTTPGVDSRRRHQRRARRAPPVPGPHEDPAAQAEADAPAAEAVDALSVTSRNGHPPDPVPPVVRFPV